MDKETRQAWEKSIRHWEEIVAFLPETIWTASLGPGSCALCQRFIKGKLDEELSPCGGCPVAIATQQTYCDGSPYLSAYDAWTDVCANLLSWEAWQAAAKAELEFLKSLREPEGNADNVG